MRDDVPETGAVEAVVEHDGAARDEGGEEADDLAVDVGQRQRVEPAVGRTQLVRAGHRPGDVEQLGLVEADGLAGPGRPGAEEQAATVGRRLAVGSARCTGPPIGIHETGSTRTTGRAPTGGSSSVVTTSAGRLLATIAWTASVGAFGSSGTTVAPTLIRLTKRVPKATGSVVNRPTRRPERPYARHCSTLAASSARSTTRSPLAASSHGTDARDRGLCRHHLCEGLLSLCWHVPPVVVGVVQPPAARSTRPGRLLWLFCEAGAGGQAFPPRPRPARARGVVAAPEVGRHTAARGHLHRREPFDAALPGDPLPVPGLPRADAPRPSRAVDRPNRRGGPTSGPARTS